MFLRTKKINGKDYAYLVRSEYFGKKVKQKVIKYLGKVNYPEKDNKISFLDYIKINFEEYAGKTTYSEFVKDVANWLVKRYNLKKGVVYKINEGFFCEYTLKKLLEFQPSKHLNPEKSFADAYLNAGFPKEEKSIFINLFMKLK